MLNAEDYKKLSDLTKIPVKTLTEAITSDKEVRIEIPSLHVYDDDELEDFKKNMTRAAGKTAIEMAIKEVRNELGLELTEKTVKGLVDAVTEKAKKDTLEEAKVEPNKKIEEANKIIDNLRKELTKAETEKEEAIKKANLTMSESKINKTLTQSLTKEIMSVFDADEIDENIFVFKNKYQVEEEDGKLVVKKDGEIIRDKTQNPISPGQVFSEYMTKKAERFAPPERKGRGDGDYKPRTVTDVDGIKNSDDAHKYIDENKLDEQQQVELITKIRKNIPGFVLE